MLGGGALLTLVGLLAGESSRVSLAAVSLRSGLAFLYLVVAGSLVAFSCYAWLLRVSTPAKASTYAYVNPLVAVALGHVAAGEPLTLRTIVAAAVIIAGVVAMTRAKAAGGGEH